MRPWWMAPKTNITCLGERKDRSKRRRVWAKNWRCNLRSIHGIYIYNRYNYLCSHIYTHYRLYTYIYIVRHIIFKLTKYKDSGWTWRITSHVFTRPWCLWHLGLLLTTIRLQAPYTTYQIVSYKGYLKNQHIFAPQGKHDFHMMNNVNNVLDLPHY